METCGDQLTICQAKCGWRLRPTWIEATDLWATSETTWTSIEIWYYDLEKGVAKYAYTQMWVYGSDTEW
ncbi:hypothetical protein FRC18_007818 [Serendipita sp. 400]|nr:hypothetical protein FRC18_007818 [Serendipita sp. 400]